MFEQQVYDALHGNGKVSFDTLIEAVKCSARELSVLLINLEIKGIIAKHPNNMYSCD
jgi:predicted Rossmann fold nucleotide-binding protein DprA/Smf involved in DNA uptake